MSFFNKIITLITSWILLISPGNTYREGIVGQPRSFLPSQLETSADRTISKLLYRGLFKYDIYGALVPDLAESWEVSEDGLVYTVTLKDEKKWHDGSIITSDDVIYTAFKVPALSGVATDRVDSKTVRFTLPNKFSPFLNILTVGIMKTDSEETMNPFKPVGSSDFEVINLNYSGPVLKEITLFNRDSDEDIRKLKFRFYSNDEELVLASRLGEISGFVAQEKQQLDNFNEYKFPLQGVYYALFFNMDNEDLQDLELRRKLRSALSIEDIVGDQGIMVQGPISKSVFTDEELLTDNFDDSLEEEFLGRKISITIPDDSDHELVADKVKAAWKDKFNMDIEIKKTSPERMIDDVINPRNFEVLLYGQEVSRDPDRYVYWHSTQTESPNLNITGFKHVRADRALEEGRNVTDFSERRVHYNVFQGVIEEQIPAIFLYHPYVRYYVSESISGVGEKYTFTVADRFLDFSNWELLETN